MKTKWFLILLSITTLGSIAILWLMPEESLKTKYDKVQIGMSKRQIGEFMSLRRSSGDHDAPAMPAQRVWVAEGDEGSDKHDKERFSQTRFVSEGAAGFVELYFNYDLIGPGEGRLVRKVYWDKNLGRTESWPLKIFGAAKALLP